MEPKTNGVKKLGYTRDYFVGLVLYEKMIVLLAGEEIEGMLLAAGAGEKPEDIIGQEIEKFRLRM